MDDPGDGVVTETSSAAEEHEKKVGIDALLRDSLLNEQGAQPLVLCRDGAGGPLHVQRGLDTATLVPTQSALEVGDELALPSATASLAVAVLYRCGGRLSLQARGCVMVSRAPAEGTYGLAHTFLGIFCLSRELL